MNKIPYLNNRCLYSRKELTGKMSKVKTAAYISKFGIHEQILMTSVWNEWELFLLAKSLIIPMRK